eukprot:9822181-Ditylum_brightwellii.AAC.1
MMAMMIRGTMDNLTIVDITSMLEEEEEDRYLDGSSTVRPIMHGLCTLGNDSLSYWTQKEEKQQNKHHQLLPSNINETDVKCSFVKPLPVGGPICIWLWENKKDYSNIQSVDK